MVILKCEYCNHRSCLDTGICPDLVCQVDRKTFDFSHAIVQSQKLESIDSDDNYDSYDYDLASSLDIPTGVGD